MSKKSKNKNEGSQAQSTNSAANSSADNSAASGQNNPSGKQKK